ncbi:MAG: histidine kinase [Gammaproteobacteria bacterium]|nr:histidine kinase [Gammaproteobacteria bacterium]
MGSEAQGVASANRGSCGSPAGGFARSDFRLLAEALPHMVWVCRPDGTLEYMNSRGLGYFGANLRNSIKLFPSGLVAHPDDRERSRAAWEHALCVQEALSMEARLQRSDGEFRWHLIRAQPVRDDAGLLVKWMGTSTDVHSVKEGLAASEQRLRLAQAVAQIGAWELQPDAESIHFSPESYELFGLAVNAPVNPYQQWLSLIDPRDRHAVRDLIEQCNLSETAEVEYRYRHPSRGLRWIHCRAGRFDDSVPRLIVGISLDVTQRRTAEEALKDVNQRKDEFLAMLAHELRNPLAPIRNAAQILRAHSTEEPELEWARTVIERQTQHLVRLVDDLLDASRIVRGKIVLKKSTMEISELIQHAVDTSQPLIRSRRHHLHVTLPPGSLTIEGDLTRLAQALANLLNNAAKYTDEGGQIWLDVSTDTRDVVLRVRDSGPGIAPTLLPHVFDLFTQAERPLDRAQGGLGVGLTLVKVLIEMHGGTVEARNAPAESLAESAARQGLAPGHGAEFIIRLPAQTAGAAKSTAARAGVTHAQAAMPAGERPMRILVVDDNVDAADSIALLLGMDGFDARSVHGSLAALDTVGSFKPDVVLLDIGLPVLDGYEVAQRLRVFRWEQPIRIVALSGYGQQADREKAARAGFDDYLVKPVEPTALTEFLRSLH